MQPTPPSIMPRPKISRSSLIKPRMSGGSRPASPTIEQFEQALRASPKDFLRALLGNLTEATRGARSTLDHYCIGEIRCRRAAEPRASTKRIEASTISSARARETSYRPRPSRRMAAKAWKALKPRHMRATGSLARAGHDRKSRGSVADAGEDFGILQGDGTALDDRFTLDDVIRRARMTLPELLAELLPDAAARRTFLMSAGIRPPDG